VRPLGKLTGAILPEVAILAQLSAAGITNNPITSTNILEEFIVKFTSHPF
jgi:hypothetical protein